MNPEQIRARLDAIENELRRIDHRAGDRALVGPEQQRFQALVDERDQLRAEQRNGQRSALTAGLATGAVAIEGGDGATGMAAARAGVTPPAAGTRDAALRLLESLHTRSAIPAHGAERLEALVRDGADRYVARYTIAAGEPAYGRAFGKLMRDPVRGHLDWTPEEGEAWRQVRALDSETRALGTGDVNGILVPLTIDPAIIITNAGTINPIRAISRNVTTLTLDWSGVTSAGVTSHWYAEGAEVSDDTPTVAQPTIKTHRSSTFVPFSIEAGDDDQNLLTQLGGLMADSTERLWATAFVTGAGDASNEPYGVVTSLAGGASEVAPVTAETLDAATVQKVFNALPARHKARAQWAMNGGIINELEALETTSGGLRFPSLQQTPPVLLRKPVNECSDMDGTYNVAATANNYLIIIGDWENYVIVTRLGSRVELIPHLMGANRRPTGQRAVFQLTRVGAEVVNIDGLRLLNLATTA